jgi:hypothetical protein
VLHASQDIASRNHDSAPVRVWFPAFRRRNPASPGISISEPGFLMPEVLMIPEFHPTLDNLTYANYTMNYKP